MKYIFLNQAFFNDYQNCPEIEKKQNRPYIQIQIEINGILFGIPLRSSIKHKYAFWTDKENGCGADYSKAVVITKQDYIDTVNIPHIRENEHNKLKGREYLIIAGMKKYIKLYLKAKSNPDVPRNRQICDFSALKYFEEYLSGINLQGDILL